MTLGIPLAGVMFEDSTLGVVTRTLGRPGEKTVKPLVSQGMVQAFTKWLFKKARQSKNQIQVMTHGKKASKSSPGMGCL